MHSDHSEWVFLFFKSGTLGCGIILSIIN